MRLSWLVVLALLVACGEKEPGDLSCRVIEPSAQVAFPDGSVKTCHRLDCDTGCTEWVCRDNGQQDSCRSINGEQDR